MISIHVQSSATSLLARGSEIPLVERASSVASSSISGHAVAS
jgi:hypothetical protein